MSGRSIYGAVSITAMLLTQHANAAYVGETERNNTLATANHVDAPSFTTDYVEGITNRNQVNTSTTVPHASFVGNGNLFDDVLISGSDYFSFTVPVAGTRGVFDLDAVNPLSNTDIYLYDSLGNLLAESDDHSFFDLGSILPGEPFLEYTFASAGLYYLGIGGALSQGSPGGITGGGLALTDSYIVHASLNAVPEPVSVLLFGAGVAGLAGYRRRKMSLVADSPNE